MKIENSHVIYLDVGEHEKVHTIDIEATTVRSTSKSGKAGSGVEVKQEPEQATNRTRTSANLNNSTATNNATSLTTRSSPSLSPTPLGMPPELSPASTRDKWIRVIITWSAISTCLL